MALCLVLLTTTCQKNDSYSTENDLELLEKFCGPRVHNIITGERLTLDKMSEIEIKAMVQAGIPEDVATGWMVKAMEDLQKQGVKYITNIPWAKNIRIGELGLN